MTIQIIIKPYLVKSGKSGKHQGYRGYGFARMLVLNSSGGIIKSGLTPWDWRSYPDPTKGSHSGYLGIEVPEVRDNPDVGNDATGSYPGKY